LFDILCNKRPKRAADRVRRFEMMHGVGVRTQVVEGLAGCEVELHPLPLEGW
jgi:hypothetical protein